MGVLTLLGLFLTGVVILIFSLGSQGSCFIVGSSISSFIDVTSTSESNTSSSISNFSLFLDFITFLEGEVSSLLLDPLNVFTILHIGATLGASSIGTSSGLAQMISLESGVQAVT